MTTLSLSTAASALTAEVVASLPVSYTYARSGDDAQVAVVDGSVPEWPDHAGAAVRAGVGGLVVLDPIGAPAAGVRRVSERAAAAGVTVVLSESWAGDPSVHEVRDKWGAPIASSRTVESFLVETSLGAGTSNLLLRQLRVLRGLGVEGVDVRGGADTPHAYYRVGRTAQGARMILSGVRSSGSASQLEVVCTGASDTVTLTLASPRTALPACATRVTPMGGDVLATIYETGHRAAFRRLHRLIAHRETADDLAGFADDVEIAALLPRAALHPVSAAT